MRELPQQDTCRKCREMLPSGARFCACGAPTWLASFEERNVYEAKQWRAHKTAQAS